MTIIMAAGLLVPFVLITDIFPFTRFGMFAEPIKTTRQTERFLIYEKNQQGIQKPFESREIGINPNTFHYLFRNYLYRNELNQFSSKIFRATGEDIQELTFIHIITKEGHTSADTIHLGTYYRNGQ